VQGVLTMAACKQANEPEAVDRLRLLRGVEVPLHDQCSGHDGTWAVVER
jgi:hypothetical protein